MNKNILPLFFISVVTTLFTSSCGFFSYEPSFEEIMRQPTIMLNKKGSRMIDKEIRFDSGQVLPNKVFQYNCTVVNFDSTELNVQGLKRDAEPVLLQRVKTSPGMQILRDNKATIQYKYNDKNGQTLFILPFTPAQYLD